MARMSSDPTTVKSFGTVVADESLDPHVLHVMSDGSETVMTEGNCEQMRCVRNY